MTEKEEQLTNKSENIDSPLDSETPPISEKNDEIEAATHTKTKDNTAVFLNEKQKLSLPMPEMEAKKQMTSRSRRTFLIGGVTALAGIFGWRLMPNEWRNTLVEGAFKFNEKLSQIFYSPKRLAPEFSQDQITEARTNGGFGLDENFNPADWRLQVIGLANARQFPQFSENILFDRKNAAPPKSLDEPPVADKPQSGLLLTLEDIKALPRVEMTTELKCIEGWSIVVNWAGARFSDFAAKYLPKTRNGSQPDLQNNPDELVRYVSLMTPDQAYFVGWDLPSILHPQTLLVYEMNGAPLTMEHGAPLRLASPTKYGIKQIKRIGRIEFTDERPKDYWAQEGYDWYSGH